MNADSFDGPDGRTYSESAAATEVRTCYCGTTAPVVPGVFPHDECDGSVLREPLPAGWQHFRKLPVTVAAIRWTGDNEAEVQALTGRADFYAVGPEDREDPDQTATVYDKLHSTWVNVYTGQWVVRGVRGEFYPLADEVHAETYEEACEVQPG